MRSIGVLVVLGAAWLSAGCGGARAAEPGSAAPGAGAAKSAPAPAMEAPASAEGASAEEAAPSAAAGDAVAKSKAERPGLGTEWGASRESRITTTSFTRSNPSTPFDTLKLFYNDVDGARAMARRAGITEMGTGMARTGQGAVSVRLLGGNGQPLDGFSAGANTYIVGVAGERYTIELRNHTGARFEAVTTVDGLDVINGQSGALSNRGYILNPWSTLEIDGWRRSSAEVAEFRFGRVSESYAAKTGSDRNVGVIGVALFDERGASVVWSAEEIDKRHAADPFPAGPGRAQPDQPLTF